MAAEAERRFCSFFVARLGVEVARLRDVFFPGHATGPRKWLSFVSGILNTASGYLTASADTQLSEQQASRLIRDAELLAQFAYETIRDIAGADATQIPHQVVAPFQRWVDRLGVINTIFFRVEHVPNYELAWFDYSRFRSINNPAATLTRAIDAIDWPVLRVTVPGQALGMLPHYAVVGHELGHAIQDQIRPNLSSVASVLTECCERIKSRLLARSLSFDTNELIQIAGIVDSWINELKADAVGHHLTGPAFFLALCGYLELAGQAYGISPSHPPSDLRRKLLVDQLSTGKPSFTEVLRAKVGLILTETVNSIHVPACPPADQLFLELIPQYGPVTAAICVELVPYMQ